LPLASTTVPGIDLAAAAVVASGWVAVAASLMKDG